jgi:hypothetical protein
MKIDIGESLVYSYLRHVRNCYLVQINWKPSGNWVPDQLRVEMAIREFERIQHHPAFIEIFKTGFENTLKQTEIDVLGSDSDDTVYAVNVAFHELGINFGARTDTRNRVIKNLLRAYLAMLAFFPGKKHRLIFCSPKVLPNTEEILRDYFKILENDFENEQNRFIYLSNEEFRDKVMMETLDCIQEEFDTSELFLRSFKLLTVYADETSGEDSGTDNHPEAKKISEKMGNSQEVEINENSEPDNREDQAEIASAESIKGERGDEKIRNEVLKVLNRVPKWLKHPDQTNSKILITFMNLLEKSEEVTLEQLAVACSDVQKFSGNFAQMNNFAEKNHGKVFSVVNGKVILWEPVKEFIIQQYIEFKKSYYQGTA